MKNLTKKTIATLILLITTSITVWADGEGQCPRSTAPCFADRPTIDKNQNVIDKKQVINELGDIFSLIFKNISLIF